MLKGWNLNSFLDVSRMAHCRSCCQCMTGIYDQRLRDYCHECLLIMAIENARRIIKPRKVKK
jgi:hypothetical protein